MTTHKPTNGFTHPSDSAIIIDHRTSRSLKTAALQTLLQPFKSQLFKISVQPAGSGILKPPSSIHSSCNIHDRKVKDIRIYDINARSKSTQEYVAYTAQVRAQCTEDALLGARRREEDIYRRDRQRQILPASAVPPVPQSELKQQSPEIWNRTRSIPPLASDFDAPIPSTTQRPQTPDGETLELVRTKTRDFAHKATKSRPRPRQIYYFAGGGWQMPPTKDHWKMCASFATTMTKNGIPTTVSVVSSPLAPHTPAGLAMPMLEKMYYELFTPVALMVPDPKNSEHYLPEDVQMPEIILAGDSSGGNIALALTLHILTKDKNAPAPNSLLLISPSVQMPTDNPQIRSLEKNDPILSLRTIQQTHAAWPAASTGSSPRVCNAIDPKDPLVSPIFGDLAELKRRNVSVNGVIAGHDVLSADAKDFVEKLKEVGVGGKWLEWDRMMHCFPLTASYGVKEGKEGVAWIIETVEAERRR